MKNQRKLTTVDERSERASAASEASGAFRSWGEALRSKTDPNRSKRLPSGRANERNDRSERSAQEPWGGFAIQNPYKKFASRSRKINGASRSMSNQVYVGGFLEHKRDPERLFR